MIRRYRMLLASVIVAFFLWFYVKSTAVFQLTIAVPVEVVNLRAGTVLISDVPEAIPIRFESDGKSLLALKYLWDVKYQLDLADYVDGSPLVLSDIPSNVKWPDKNNVRIISILAPDTLRVYSEVRVSRRVPVYADVEVSCEPGFVVVRGLQVRPDSLTVEGPRSLVESIPYLRTEARSLKGLSKDVVVRTALLRPDSKRLTVEQSPIDVTIDVQPLGERTMENIPLKLIHLPESVQAVVQPSTFSIRIRGGVDLLATMSRDSVIGMIDYEAETRLNHVEATPTIQVPADVEWSQLIPSRFKIILLETEP